MPAIPHVEIYTKEDCPLCDEAKTLLERVRTEIPFELSVVDILSDPALAQRYRMEIPVVFIAGRKAFKYHVDETALRKKLAQPDLKT